MRAGALLCFITLSSAAIAAVVPDRRDQPWSEAERQADRHGNARNLYYALSLWERENGALPYSPEGPEHALYKLKEYLPRCPILPELGPGLREPGLDIGVFELPYGILGNKHPHWDDRRKRLVEGAYDYLNEARRLDWTEPAFAVYAEKRGIGGGGRWVVFCNGARLWVTDKNALANDVLGKSLAELVSAEPLPAAAPVAALGKNAFFGRMHQMVAIWGVLYSYAQDHGALPYSEKGADYALYELKAYVQSPVLFDAAYTRLENGVAYWDDEKRCLANGDFEYANLPLSLDEFRKSWYPLGDSTVLIADKWGAYTPALRWIQTSSMAGCTNSRRGQCTRTIRLAEGWTS